MVSTVCSVCPGTTKASATIPRPRMSLIWIRCNLYRQSGICAMKESFLGGDEIKVPPKMFVGAAANPFADPFKIRVPRLAKKIAAGAEFIQTQCVYNLDKFELWMKGVVERGLHEKVFIMPGITPMRSVGMAKYMARAVPGMDVPKELDRSNVRCSKGQAGRGRNNYCG